MSTSSTLHTKTSASSWLWNSCHRTFPKDLLLVSILLEFSSLFASRVVVPSRFLSFRLLFNCHRSRRLCSWGFDEAARQVPLMTQHNRCRWVHRCFKVLSHIPQAPDFNIFQHFYVVSCGTQYGVRELHFMMRMLRSWVQQLVAVASCTLLAIFLLRLHMFSVGT